MAGKSTISITFKLDGDGNGFKNLANDANGFKKALNSTLSEAQKFNASARQDAFDKAYSAALALFAQYKKSGGGAKKAKTPTTSKESCEAFLASLSGEERRTVYESTTAEGARYRAELIASVGTLGYIQLVGKYPSKP